MNRPTLLLVHGLIGPLDYFDPASQIFSAQVRRIDLLGYGSHRDVKPERLTLSGQADHVAGHLEALGGKRVYLLGHSMGGAVAMILADRRPDLLSGIINVEGNFTLQDAFWSRAIVGKSPQDWADEHRKQQEDIPGTLARWGIRETPKRLDWAEQILAHQPPGTVHAMACAIVRETEDPEFLEAVRRVVRRDMPIHLIAGERSARSWDVPDFLREAARSYSEIADAGHLMMLEQPDRFCKTVESILSDE